MLRNPVTKLHTYTYIHTYIYICCETSNKTVMGWVPKADSIYLVVGPDLLQRHLISLNALLKNYD